jgi:putative protease
MINNKLKNKIELLAPAGSLEKMRWALHFGADAVYCGIAATSMRARMNPFTEESLAKAIKEIHEAGKKIYVTANIYAHNCHLAQIEEHAKFLEKVRPDAVIISDPGVISIFKQHAPSVPIHISTQANVTNWQAAKFWHDLGAERVVLAREVTLEDIKEIHAKVPDLELEYFVHGAMCMSYSGRCILSKWMMGRSANLGDCVQPCRWGYKIADNIQQATDNENAKCPPAGEAGKNQNTKCQCKMKNENADEVKLLSVTEIQGRHEVELEEDRHGTYFFNSKDLNLLAHVKDLVDAGVVSLKIEGRNKSVSYVASVTRAYRKVLDSIFSEGDVEKVVAKNQQELDKLMNRGYTEGFLLGNEPEHNMENSHDEPKYQFVGEVLEVGNGRIKAYVHNQISVGDEVEIMGPDEIKHAKIKRIRDKDANEATSAHGGHESIYDIEFDVDNIEKMSLIRKVLENN